MPVQLRATYIHMFTFLVIFGVYAFWIFNVMGVAYFTGPDALIRIGRSICVLIVAGYAFEIVVTLLTLGFNVKVLKNMTAAEIMVDERDKQIFFKSMYGSHMVLVIGLCASMVTLAMGWAPFWVFNMLVLAYALSVLMELGTKLFLYKRSV